MLILLLPLLLSCSDAPVPAPAPKPAAKPAPTPAAKPAPKPAAPTPAPASGPRLASDGATGIPEGGCEKDGIVYDAAGSAYGCVGGGNWCANTPPTPGICKQ